MSANCDFGSPTAYKALSGHIKGGTGNGVALIRFRDIMAVRPPLFRGQTRGKAERNRDHDERRGSAHSRGYGRKWQRERTVYLDEHPLCLGCEAVGVVEAAVVVDHIVRHKGDDKLFWRRSNWQQCCLWHHDKIKQALEQMFDRGDITAADLRLDSATAVRLTRESDRFRSMPAVFR
jgi:5-methylcytosine-specific restriction enzyme A